MQNIGLMTPGAMQQDRLNRQSFFQNLVMQGSAERLRQKAIEQAKAEQKKAEEKANKGGIFGGVLGAIGGGITGFMTGGGPAGALLGALKGGVQGYQTGRQTGDATQGALLGAATGGITGIEEKQRKDSLLAAAEQEQFDRDIKLEELEIARKKADKPGVQVNVGDKGKFGTIPPGYMIKENKDGFFMEPIPGGPAAQKAKSLLKAEKANTEMVTEKTNFVVRDIKRLKDKIESAPWFSPVAGVFAEKFFPDLRQNRVDASQLRETIVANIGFDRLQEMRESSPTGGALGQVSERELSTLQAVAGSIELVQSEDQLLKNLEDLNTKYNNIMRKFQAYPNASEFDLGKSISPVSNLDDDIMGILDSLRVK